MKVLASILKPVVQMFDAISRPMHRYISNQNRNLLVEIKRDAEHILKKFGLEEEIEVVLSYEPSIGMNLFGLKGKIPKIEKDKFEQAYEELRRLGATVDRTFHHSIQVKGDKVVIQPTYLLFEGELATDHKHLQTS